MLNMTQKMDEYKAKLVEQDKERAIEALVEYIHYGIAPRMNPGREAAPLDIFRSESDVDSFCETKGIPKYAMSWLIAGLIQIRVMERMDSVVRLTAGGVVRYCVPPFEQTQPSS
jgi:hypothetical protein